MLEILTDNETRLMAENEVLRGRIDNALASIEAMYAVPADGEFEEDAMHAVCFALGIVSYKLRA